MNIKIFTTGGSVDKTYCGVTSAFEVGDPQAATILDEANVSFDYEIQSLLRKDSLDITPEDRQKIVDAVRADPCRRILITHGTDTMPDTGQALLGIPDKVIVLTGAMRPAAFRDSDAPFNLGAAIIALQTLPDGVYLVMNGLIFDPRRTQKNVQFSRFQQE